MRPSEKLHRKLACPSPNKPWRYLSQSQKITALLTTQRIRALAPQHWQALLAATGRPGREPTARRESFEKRMYLMQQTVESVLGEQPATPTHVARSLHAIEETQRKVDAARLLAAKFAAVPPCPVDDEEVGLHASMACV